MMFTKVSIAKKIDKLSAKDKKKLDYKKLRLSDYLYSSGEEEEEEEEQKPTKDDYKTLIKQIIDEETNINKELFKKYFSFQKPSDMIMLLNKTNDTEKNKLVSLINSGLKDLKEEIKKMSKGEIENEDPELIVEVVEKILKFNEQNQQKGQGIKILTPSQMLNRLPIALVQLQAGNNSNNLKNEIRQLLYSLYHSKNMTKQIYKSLVLFKKNGNNFYEYRK